MSEQVFGTGEFSVQDLIDEQNPQAPAAEGQPDDETVPEESGQPDESAPEAPPATQEAESTTDDGDSKLLAGKFKTEGALFKGATEISDFLGETVDFAEMSAAQIEEYYTGARKRLSQRGEGGQRPDSSQLIVEKLEQLIELQSRKPQEPTKSPEPSASEEITDEELDELFYESPAKAMKKMMSLANRQQPQPQPANQPQVPNVDWNPIVTRVQNMVDTHGDGDFDAMRPQMAKLIEQNPGKYLADREHGIFRAYQDAKALTVTNGQLKTIAANRQDATGKIEKLKRVASIETGRSSREPENQQTQEEALINRIFSDKPKKGIWG